MINVEIIPYAGWKQCLRIHNNDIEAVITAEVGPRVIRFGFIGGQNEFVEYPEQVGVTGGEKYRSYGGHRLWVAPEDTSITYYPDNHPVEWKVIGQSLHVVAPVEATTGLQKEMEFWIDGNLNTVHVIHRIRNCGTKTMNVSAWALSVMAAGGRAIVPQEPYQPHPDQVLPVRPLVLWSYTDMSDSRCVWGKQFIQLSQDVNAKLPLKIGLLNKQGWIAYANGERLFIKTVPYTSQGSYPDFGCNTEIFTNAKMLELETLSPRISLEPEEVLRHEEHWFLYRGIQLRSDERMISEMLNHLYKR
jgi:hypothetical protein